MLRAQNGPEQVIYVRGLVALKELQKNYRKMTSECGRNAGRSRGRFPVSALQHLRVSAQ
jgi:hypothetical protein